MLNLRIFDIYKDFMKEFLTQCGINNSNINIEPNIFYKFAFFFLRSNF